MNIACISDTHCTVPELDSQSLFPRQISALKEKGAEMYERIRKEIQLAYSISLEWLKNHEPWDLLVHLGDVTGGYKEQGCCHPSVQQLAKKVVGDLESVTSSVRFVLGNHDTGYSHKGSLPGSGISMASICFCKEIFGDLFWVDERHGFLSIGVCSPIAEYNGSDSEILSIKRRQAEFLADVLSAHKGFGSWILYIHDSFALKHLVKEIKGHTSRLQGVVCGDFHDPWKWKLLRMWGLGSTLWNQTLFRCFKKSIFCPSVAPLWWQGYRLLTLFGNGKTQEIVLDRSLESRDLPTSSFWRCLWWMMRPQLK